LLPVHTETHALSCSNIDLRKNACLALYKAGDINILIQPFLLMKKHEDYITLLSAKNVGLDLLLIYPFVLSIILASSRGLPIVPLFLLVLVGVEKLSKPLFLGVPRIVLSLLDLFVILELISPCSR